MRTAAPSAAHLVLKPMSNKIAKPVSSTVAAIARIGTIPAEAKEFTSPAYTKKFFQPPPHNPNRLPTADKKSAANANLNSNVAKS